MKHEFHRQVSLTPSLNLTSSQSERDDEEMNDMIAHIRSSACADTRRASLSAMMSQEDLEVYQVCDYLESYDQSEDEEENDDGRGNHLNAACRTSICEWMYRVVDHFGVDREVVSIAISYVDRVLSICLCPDRRAFKLISSASLHLAIKIHSPWQWKEICPLLPDLSRGDFDSKRIVAMENEMTHWLQWYLNQSTPQCMATYLLSLLKDVPHSVLQNITDTTIFLIEVSVCDYDFVTVRNSIIAIAAVLNATEKVGFDLCDFDNDAFSYRNDFRDQIKDILKDIDYKVNWNEVSSARDRLWSLYRNSTQSSVHQSMLVTAPIAPKRTIIDEGMSSPTSVVVAKRLRSRSDFAFREISIVPSLEFSVSSDSQDPSHVLAGDSHSL